MTTYEETRLKKCRKEKSLGRLCENFINLYNIATDSHISLDLVSNHLGVERRRIYDIVNILESIEIVTRKSKNTYIWHGLNNVSNALFRLQNQGLNPQSIPSIPQKYFNRDKSLSTLTQRFIRLFLCSSTRVVSLEQAGLSFLENSSPSNEKSDNNESEKTHIENNFNENQKSKSTSNPPNKSKFRRLYDITNVLTSVHLIEKIHLSGKPAFRWKGAGIYPLCGINNTTHSDNNINNNGNSDTIKPNITNTQTSDSIDSNPKTTNKRKNDVNKTIKKKIKIKQNKSNNNNSNNNETSNLDLSILSAAANCLLKQDDSIDVPSSPKTNPKSEKNLLFNTPTHSPTKTKKEKASISTSTVSSSPNSIASSLVCLATQPPMPPNTKNEHETTTNNDSELVISSYVQGLSFSFQPPKWNDTINTINKFPESIK